MWVQPMSTHDNKEVMCHGPLDGETHDGVLLTFEDNGQFVPSPPRSVGFESSALRFDCPECGRVQYVCPVCTDHLDPDERRAYNAAGFFYAGDDVVPCHNCNQSEVAARRRRGVRPV